MKAVSAMVLGLLVAAPIMALPTRWSSDRDAGITRYMVGARGARGSHVIIACPDGKGADVEVAIDGVLAPSDSQIGFRAANQTIVLKSNDDGLMKTDSRENAAGFARLWQAIRAGQRLEISFTNGVAASLPLTGSMRALPATPCASGFRG